VIIKKGLTKNEDPIKPIRVSNKIMIRIPNPGI
jgi:hypothetical protein